MTITGINSDLYYANNPIFITFENISSSTKYIEIYPQNLGIQNNQSGVLGPQRLYVFRQNTITIDIAHTVKLLFVDTPHNTDYTTLTPTPASRNWKKIKFIITEVDNDGERSDSITIRKTFIRGGKRTYDSNQKANINVPLISGPPINPFVLAQSNSLELIPQWAGFPIDYYYINSDRILMKSNRIPDLYKDIRKVKGCDPLYVKFLNNKGGYSYWLFESWETELNNSNLGVINAINEIKDLGNKSETQIEAVSKVPAKYIDFMFDLIDSLEVYIFRGNNNWERVTSKNNKVSKNKANTNEKVKIKLQLHHRYNPSLIW